MNKYLLLFIFSLAVFLLLFQGSAEHKKTVVHTISSDQIMEIDDKEEKRLKEAEAATFDSKSSPDSYFESTEVYDKTWEDNVKSSILRQAFDSDFEVSVVKEKSFLWKELGNEIEVDSVKVSLRNPAGETSTFRAIVDHNTGKVLRTWDRPIFDSINPRERPGIKLNPLYHPED